MGNWKQRIAILTMAGLILSPFASLAPPAVQAASTVFDYASFKGLQFADSALIPASSRESDFTADTKELAAYLKDPKTMLAVLPSAEQHPSLWFTEKELAGYQARRSMKGTYYETLWKKAETDLNDQYLGYDYTDPKLHENDRSRGAKLLAFYYMMVKDDPAVAADRKELIKRKAIDATVHMYTGTVAERTKDDGDIYWATYLQDYASAYDWLFPYLTLEENQEARARLKSEAQFIVNWLMTPQPPRPHNHRSKPALGLGTVALTLSDEPEAQYWLNIAIERTHNTLEFQFSQDGITREGAHYSQFTFVNLIPFLWQYQHLIGDNAPDNISPAHYIKQSQPVFEYALKSRMPNGWLPSQEDSYVKPNSTHMVAALYKDADASVYGTGLKLGELLQWSFFNSQLYTADYTGATSQYQINLDEYLTYDSRIAAKAPTVSRTLFMDGGTDPKTGNGYGGMTFMGNQWNSTFEPNGKESLWLSFNGVPESDNHQHPDQLHFNLFGKGALLAVDGGYGQNSSWNSWLRTAEAHNIVTMNGRSVKNETAPVVQTVRPAYEMSMPGFDFAQKSGDYYADDGSVIGTHSRAIAMPGKDYVVVADRLESKTGAADFAMNLHSLGTLELNGSHVTWSISKKNNPELTGPNANDPKLPDYSMSEAKLEAYVFPQTAAVASKNAVISLFKEDITAQYITATQKAEKANYLTVLVPQGLEEKAPDVQDLSRADMAAARVTTEKGSDMYLAKQDSSVKSAGHMTTDATFAWVRESAGGPVSDVMVREGKQLWANGVKLLAADAPITAALHYDSGAWSGTVSGLAGKTALTLALPSGAAVKGMTVEGKPYAGYQTDAKTLSFALEQPAAFAITLEGGSAASAASPQAAPVAEVKADKASDYGKRAVGTRIVDFDGSSSKGAGLKYAWDFGDGTTSGAASPKKEYQSFGSYLVNLTVTGTNGATDSKTILVENKDPNHAPTAGFSFTPDSGKPPLKVTFDAGASSDPDQAFGDKIASYAWDFGDGTPVAKGPDLKTTEHTYTKVGTMQVKLTVNDTIGAEAVKTLPLGVGSSFGYIEVKKQNPEDEQIDVLFEGEDFTNNSSKKDKQISLAGEKKASGGRYMVIGENVQDVTNAEVMDPAYKDLMPVDKIAPDMVYAEYELKVVDGGAFQTHVYSYDSNGSVLIQYDNSDLRRITLKKQDWKRAYDNYQHQLDPGVHTLRIWSRKGGADIDRILLTTGTISHTKVQSTLIPTLTRTLPAEPFADIQFHWAKEDIEEMAQHKLVNGVGEQSFGPDLMFTRAQLAAMLNRLLGLPADASAAAALKDVKSGDWFAGDAGAVVKAGLMNAAGGTFDPNRTITREEAAVSIVKALTLKNRAVAVDAAQAEALLAGFTDRDQITPALKPEFAAAVKTGILTGSDENCLSPQQSLTRGQAAAIMKRLHDRLGSK